MYMIGGTSVNCHPLSSTVMYNLYLFESFV